MTSPWVPSPDPPLGGKPIVLAPATFERLMNAATYLEQTGKIKTRWPNRTPSIGAAWLCKAKTSSTGIPAATANDTPGQGAITFCDWDDSTGKWVPGSETGVGLNPSTAGPVTSSWIVTVGWVSGQWEVQMDPCS